MTCWDGYFFLQRLLLPEAFTSSPSHLSTFPSRVSEPKQDRGAPWGWRAPHTVNFLRKSSTPSPGRWLFLLNYTAAPARHQGLKVLSEARSLPAKCLTPRGGGGGYAMGGRESGRAETDSKSIYCNGLISSLPVRLRVHCSQHAGSVPCLNARLENSCWSHLSPEESLISLHSTRSV